MRIDWLPPAEHPGEGERVMITVARPIHGYRNLVGRHLAYPDGRTVVRWRLGDISWAEVQRWRRISGS